MQTHKLVLGDKAKPQCRLQQHSNQQDRLLGTKQRSLAAALWQATSPAARLRTDKAARDVRSRAASSSVSTRNEQEQQPLPESVPSRSSSEERDDDVLIELKNVCKAFGSKQVLKGASFKIRRGEAVGIIGGSGTGKSTTLRIIAGLIDPDQGEVLIHGHKRVGLVTDHLYDDDDSLKVGLVFQSGALFDSLTVGQNVGFMLYEHTKMPEKRIKERVAECLAKVGLSGVEDLYPAELSGGMKKRVALARAIIVDDDHQGAEQVIMYDEPTAGLDPVASTIVEDLIRSMHQSPDGVSAKAANGAAPGGNNNVCAYVVVTHQHSTIRRAVDRLIFLHEGEVVWEGTVDEFDTSEEPIVRQFASGSLQGPITYA